MIARLSFTIFNTFLGINSSIWVLHPADLPLTDEIVQLDTVNHRKSSRIVLRQPPFLTDQRFYDVSRSGGEGKMFVHLNFRKTAIASRGENRTRRFLGGVSATRDERKKEEVTEGGGGMNINVLKQLNARSKRALRTLAIY